MSNWTDDLTKTGEYAYSSQRTRNGVKALATVRQSVMRRGAYQMSVSAYAVSLRPLGSRQQATADDLKLEAKGELTRALYAAGWHSEQVPSGGSTIVLWWPAK